MNAIFKEIYYAVKSFNCIKSGFVRIESRIDEISWEEFDPDWHSGYYACAKFKNGRHIPVPILSNWYNKGNSLQKIAISIARIFYPKNFQTARFESDKVEEEVY
jgi:hypothetical protein